MLERFEHLQGHTIRNIEFRSNVKGDELIFTLTNGERYMLYHDQECCEGVYVEDIDAPLSLLIGVPIILAEEVTNANGSLEGRDSSFTWTFYKLATYRGAVTIRWYGGSNGYYSEKVSWARSSRCLMSSPFSIQPSAPSLALSQS